MPNRKLLLACLTLVILAFGSFVIVSSLGTSDEQPAHVMPDGKPMQGEQMP